MYTIQDRITAKEKKAFKAYNYQRVITNAVKDLDIEEKHGLLAYVAIATTLVNGGVWDDDRVESALDEIDDSVQHSRMKIKDKLKKANILEAKKIDGVWSDRLKLAFKKQAEHFIADNINKLPASMLPLLKVPMWNGAEKNELNIAAISRVPEKVLKAQPQSVLNAINKLQAVKFTVNPVLVQYLKYRLADLSNANRARTEITVLNSQIEHLTILSNDQEEFQFLVTADFRGRCYYRGGILTPQGHDFQKAAFQFAKSRKLGESGKIALALHFANVSSQDKISTVDKYSWALNEGSVLAIQIVEDNYFPRSLSKKYQVIVAAQEWYKLMEWERKGKDASKFKSQLVCHQDGTCNGLQHGAALRKDRKTAQAVNCVASTWADLPTDIYQDGVNILVCELNKKGAKEEAKLIKKKGRTSMKQAVMITGYGAGLPRATAACLDEFNPEQKKVLTQREGLLQECVDIALNEIAGALIHTHSILMKAIQNYMAKGVQPIRWKTADGFIVFQAARATDSDKKEYKGAGEFQYRIDDIDRDKQATSITANFIHSMDGCHMRMTTQAFKYEIVTIHDSYGSHARTYFELKDIIKEQFVEIHKYDQLASLNKMNGLNIQLSPMSDYDPKEVLESEYFFS